jgi:hypothetical protein
VITPGIINLMQGYLRMKGLALVRSSDRAKLGTVNEAAELKEMIALAVDAVALPVAASQELRQTVEMTPEDMEKILAIAASVP